MTTIQISETQIKIIKLLHENKHGLFRNDIVDKLCIARTTIYNNLMKLKKLEIIDNVIIQHGQGRPKVLWLLVEYMSNYLNGGIKNDAKV